MKKMVSVWGLNQWERISEFIPQRPAAQCESRYNRLTKPPMIKGPWTIEEDEKLMEWVRREGPNKWAQAAQFIQGRSGKQCRERWFNNLNPGVKKGNWSEAEDDLIFTLYKKHGSSWSRIAKYLPGRTDTAIKNRFYSTLRKIASDKKRSKVDITVKKLEESIADNVSSVSTLPNSTAQGAQEPQQGLLAASATNRLYRLLNDVDIPGLLEKEPEKSKSPAPPAPKTPARKQKSGRGKEKRAEQPVTPPPPAQLPTVLPRVAPAYQGSIDHSQQGNHAQQFNEPKSVVAPPVENKMIALLERLQTLEKLLNSTRKEVMQLEQSYQIDLGQEKSKLLGSRSGLTQSATNTLSQDLNFTATVNPSAGRRRKDSFELEVGANHGTNSVAKKQKSMYEEDHAYYEM